MLQHPRLGNNQYLAIKLKAVKLSGIYSNWIIEEMQCTISIAKYVKKKKIGVKISDCGMKRRKSSPQCWLIILCSRVGLIHSDEITGI